MESNVKVDNEPLKARGQEKIHDVNLVDDLAISRSVNPDDQWKENGSLSSGVSSMSSSLTSSGDIASDITITSTKIRNTYRDIDEDSDDDSQLFGSGSTLECNVSEYKTDRVKTISAAASHDRVTTAPDKQEREYVESVTNSTFLATCHSEVNPEDIMRKFRENFYLSSFQSPVETVTKDDQKDAENTKMNPVIIKANSTKSSRTQDLDQIEVDLEKLHIRKQSVCDDEKRDPDGNEKMEDPVNSFQHVVDLHEQLKHLINPEGLVAKGSTRRTKSYNKPESSQTTQPTLYQDEGHDIRHHGSHPYNRQQHPATTSSSSTKVPEHRVNFRNYSNLNEASSQIALNLNGTLSNQDIPEILFPSVEDVESFDESLKNDSHAITKLPAVSEIFSNRPYTIPNRLTSNGEYGINYFSENPMNFEYQTNHSFYYEQPIEPNYHQQDRYSYPYFERSVGPQLRRDDHINSIDATPQIIDNDQNNYKYGNNYTFQEPTSQFNSSISPILKTSSLHILNQHSANLPSEFQDTLSPSPSPILQSVNASPQHSIPSPVSPLNKQSALSPTRSQVSSLSSSSPQSAKSSPQYNIPSPLSPSSQQSVRSPSVLAGISSYNATTKFLLPLSPPNPLSAKAHPLSSCYPSPTIPQMPEGNIPLIIGESLITSEKSRYGSSSSLSSDKTGISSSSGKSGSLSSPGYQSDLTTDGYANPPAYPGCSRETYDASSPVSTNYVVDKLPVPVIPLQGSEDSDEDDEDDNGNTIVHELMYLEEEQFSREYNKLTRNDGGKEFRRLVNVSNKDQRTALYIAVIRNNVTGVNKLLDEGADATKLCIRTKRYSKYYCIKYYENVLHLACEKGYKEIVKSLLSHPLKEDLINSRRLGDDKTPLLIAIDVHDNSTNDRYEIIQSLIANQADLRENDSSNGRSPLMLLIEKHELELVKNTLERLNPDTRRHLLEHTDFDKNTCLHISAQIKIDQNPNLKTLTDEDIKRFNNGLVRDGAIIDSQNLQKIAPRHLKRDLISLPTGHNR